MLRPIYDELRTAYDDFPYHPGCVTVAVFLSSIFVLLVWSGIRQTEQSYTQQVIDRGELRVVTRNHLSGFYLLGEGESYAGFEYQLVQRFADQLGVKLKVIFADSFTEMFELVQDGDADLAASSITLTPQRLNDYLFSPAYRQEKICVIYRRGESQPGSIASLIGKKILVSGGTVYQQALLDAAKTNPDLKWQVEPEASLEDMLDVLTTGDIDVTLSDCSLYDVYARFYPKTREAFALKGSLGIAWLLPEDIDWQHKVSAYMNSQMETGWVERLWSQYHDHLNEYQSAGTFRFVQLVNKRLPALVEYFKDAGEGTGFDWRFLAAVSYQESHWNAKAKSPTGVRGVMMLTLPTAKEMGLKNRLDAEGSIEAGAGYLAKIRKRLPQRISEPNRSQLTLAAYNVGYAHLEDARVICEQKGMNPDLWADVKQCLPLLTKKEWYLKARYGYAQGFATVEYVDLIQSFYEILLWLDSRESIPD